MKRTIKNLGLVFIFLFSYKHAFSQVVDYSVAKVGERTQGVYIFINAEPVQPYDYIATVEVSDFWIRKTPREAFQRLIEKSKNKYPNFNGIIFHSNNFHKADLIKFKGLEISGGGFRIADKITFKDLNNKIIYGEILTVDNSKQESTFKYLDEFNSEKYKTVKYTKLQSISEEEYTKAIKSASESKKIYVVGQKISWTEFNQIKYGIIQDLNLETQKTSIKYLLDNGQEKIKVKSLDDIFPANETDYQNYVDKIQNEVKKHLFKVGDKVKWIKFNSTVHGQIISVDEIDMKATVKYINDKNLEKNITLDVFDLVKDE